MLDVAGPLLTRRPGIGLFRYADWNAHGRPRVVDNMSEHSLSAEGGSIQRVCAEPRCATMLSRYNEFDFCSLHQPMVVPRMRGKVL